MAAFHRPGATRLVPERCRPSFPSLYMKPQTCCAESPKTVASTSAAMPTASVKPSSARPSPYGRASKEDGTCTTAGRSWDVSIPVVPASCRCNLCPRTFVTHVSVRTRRRGLDGVRGSLLRCPTLRLRVAGRMPRGAQGRSPALRWWHKRSDWLKSRHRTLSQPLSLPGKRA